jgi:hypothetical protein
MGQDSWVENSSEVCSPSVGGLALGRGRSPLMLTGKPMNRIPLSGTGCTRHHLGNALHR